MKKLPFRIGQGYDVHRFQEGRPLTLGGVLIPNSPGLLGHSDADVLLHAIIDAMLGAVAMGDIGAHFPDTNAEYEGVDSGVLLCEVARLIKDNTGLVIGNIDATVVTEHPRLRPHIDKIRESIATLLELDLSQVSVKATTNEKMGPFGRGEGMLAHAVAMLLDPDALSGFSVVG